MLLSPYTYKVWKRWFSLKNSSIHFLSGLLLSFNLYSAVLLFLLDSLAVLAIAKWFEVSMVFSPLPEKEDRLLVVVVKGSLGKGLASYLDNMVASGSITKRNYMVSVIWKEEGHEYHSSTPVKCSTIKLHEVQLPHLHSEWSATPTSSSHLNWKNVFLLKTAAKGYDQTRAYSMKMTVTWDDRYFESLGWCPLQAIPVISAHNSGNSNILRLPCQKKRQQEIPNKKTQQCHITKNTVFCQKEAKFHPEHFLGLTSFYKSSSKNTTCIHKIKDYDRNIYEWALTFLLACPYD